MSALQLFCLPHAWGSAAFYRRWSESLPEWIQVRPLELPEPGELAADGRHVDIDMLVRQLAGELTDAALQPYVLFGHGLGGLLAYELAHRLRLCAAGEPLALFVSGVVAPSRCVRHGATEMRTDTWLHAPDEERSDSPLREVAAAPAELPWNGGYAYRQRAPLRTSVHVLGRRQGAIRVEALLEWQRETRGDFSLDLLERHHFFIQQQEARTLRLVCRHCERYLRHWRLDGRRAAG
ncbi:MAG TPA: thioesterase domain-containing protein [Pseudomonas sp.]